MNSNKPHQHNFIQKVDLYDQLRWHECTECKQWEECHCTEEGFEKSLYESIKFSDELLNRAEEYLEKKTNSRPSKSLTISFLSSVAKLGHLFLKNAHLFNKQGQ